MWGDYWGGEGGVCLKENVGRLCVCGGGGGGGVEEAKDTPEDQIVHFTSLQ